MKLEDFRKEGYFFSEQASSSNQKLAITGIAIIWLFRITYVNGELGLSKILLLSLLLFIASILIEILYYSISSIIWDRLYHNHLNTLSDEEKKAPDEADRDEPPDTWPRIIFFTKIGATIVGYILLASYLIQNISVS